MSARWSVAFLFVLAGTSWLCYCPHVSAALVSPAQNSAAADIDANYKDELVKLQAPYCGQKLRFDATGALVSGGRPNDSPNCQVIGIQRVAVENESLIVTAQRVLAPADWATGDCAAGPKAELAGKTPEADKNAATHTGPVDGGGLVIEIELPNQPDSGVEKSLMEKVFSPLKIPVLGIGSDITPPVAIYMPDPSYSMEARKARYQGIIALTIVVGPDGKVYRPRVIRSLGMGLDEKALEGVLKWRFKPARRCGVPIPVQINAEIQFRI